MFMLTVVNVYVDNGECLYTTGRVGWAVNVYVDSGECLYHPDW